LGRSSEGQEDQEVNCMWFFTMQIFLYWDSFTAQEPNKNHRIQVTFSLNLLYKVLFITQRGFLHKVMS
jgi:hypothetical protein